jgi:predicted 3-demethylubiquinone-9 3-methyltransferase (glyoxalase superfamily)
LRRRIGELDTGNLRSEANTMLDTLQREGSLVVNCETQEEVDELWDKLSDGGQKGPCAWLKDKFGLSWQVVPTALIEMLRDEDEAKSARVMRAMMRMGKIDIGELKRAYEAKTL